MATKKKSIAKKSQPKREGAQNKDEPAPPRIQDGEDNFPHRYHRVRISASAFRCSPYRLAYAR